MKTSTQDKVAGTIKQASGYVKEKAGQATNDPDMRDRGTAERIEGKAQKKVGDVKKVFEL